MKLAVKERNARGPLRRGPVQSDRRGEDGLGRNDEAVRQRCDVTLSKMRFDACSDGLAELLTEGCTSGDRPAVVIAGCEAHVCLMQTALGLLERGFQTWVAETACGLRRTAVKQAAMQRLREAGATVVSDEMVLFEWVRHCRHPRSRPCWNWSSAAPIMAAAEAGLDA